MKKLLTILMVVFFVGVGCKEEMNLGASLDMSVNINDLQTRIDAEQADWILTHDKYKYIPKTIDPDTGIEYRVDEYETPREEIGYQTLFYDKEGRITTSTATGIQEANRTFIKNYPSLKASST